MSADLTCFLPTTISRRFQARAIGSEMGIDFVGSGWYMKGDDTILVVAIERDHGTMWNEGATSDEEVFECHTWHTLGTSTVCSVFEQIATAPDHSRA